MCGVRNKCFVVVHARHTHMYNYYITTYHYIVIIIIFISTKGIDKGGHL